MKIAPWPIEPAWGSAAIVFYALLYAVLHSALAGRVVKEWARRRWGTLADRWYRLGYNFLAIVLLLPLGLMLVKFPDRTLYTLASPWYALALGIEGLALLGILYGVWITDAWSFLGIRQLFNPQCAETYRCVPLIVTGMYRWVRHPQYLFGLILLWCAPNMTMNRAVLSLVFSLYLYIGTFLEERRLVAEYGETYRQYQRQVPRLFPWRGPVRVRLER
ncbi:MAG: NnrU family protein [Anaerolineae bacterium]|nr:NnrU family protein [Anaerolineae bacterium]MDW8072575.1 NnrU family protein [Anaerolineae bacterium]